MPVKIYSVSELSQLIKELLESNFYGVWIEGEVSSMRYSSTGHLYFSLVDDNASIGAIIYRGKLKRLGFELSNGMRVVVFGHLSLYLKGGEYRIAVEHVRPSGVGRRFFDLERLKEEFKRKGYFDRKRPVPYYPRKIVVLTSPTGAAVRDIINIVWRRGFDFDLFVYPVSVQGEEARYSILTALKEINSIDENIDVVVLARGGGSNEDLWLFNDPDIAKAFFDVKFPTISAIGHEVDFTLCDFVADLRAETPSAAAELLTQGRQELKNRLINLKDSLGLSVRRIIERKADRLRGFSSKRLRLRLRGLLENRTMYLDALSERIFSSIDRAIVTRSKRLISLANRIRLNSPSHRLDVLSNRVDVIRERLDRSIDIVLDKADSRVRSLSAQLNALSPLNILKKGYSITLNSEGRAIKTYSDVEEGERITTLLHSGTLTSIVEKREAQKIKKQGR